MQAWYDLVLSILQGEISEQKVLDKRVAAICGENRRQTPEVLAIYNLWDDWQKCSLHRDSFHQIMDILSPFSNLPLTEFYLTCCCCLQSFRDDARFRSLWEKVRPSLLPILYPSAKKSTFQVFPQLPVGNHETLLLIAHIPSIENPCLKEDWCQLQEEWHHIVTRLMAARLRKEDDIQEKKFHYEGSNPDHLDAESSYFLATTVYFSNKSFTRAEWHTLTEIRGTAIFDRLLLLLPASFFLNGPDYRRRLNQKIELIFRPLQEKKRKLRWDILVYADTDFPMNVWGYRQHDSREQTPDTIARFLSDVETRILHLRTYWLYQTVNAPAQQVYILKAVSLFLQNTVRIKQNLGEIIPKTWEKQNQLQSILFVGGKKNVLGHVFKASGTFALSPKTLGAGVAAIAIVTFLLTSLCFHVTMAPHATMPAAQKKHLETSTGYFGLRSRIEAMSPDIFAKPELLQTTLTDIDRLRTQSKSAKDSGNDLPENLGDALLPALVDKVFGLFSESCQKFPNKEHVGALAQVLEKIESQWQAPNCRILMVRKLEECRQIFHGILAESLRAPKLSIPRIKAWQSFGERYHWRDWLEKLEAELVFKDEIYPVALPVARSLSQKEYDSFFTKFADFLCQTLPAFEEKYGKYYALPPRAASYAYSSRGIYHNLLRVKMFFYAKEGYLKIIPLQMEPTPHIILSSNVNITFKYCNDKEPCPLENIPVGGRQIPFMGKMVLRDVAIEVYYPFSKDKKSVIAQRFEHFPWSIFYPGENSELLLKSPKTYAFSQGQMAPITLTLLLQRFIKDQESERLTGLPDFSLPLPELFE